MQTKSIKSLQKLQLFIFPLLSMSSLAHGSQLLAEDVMAKASLPEHERRIREIQERIPFEMSPGLNFFEQVDAIQKLHDLAITSPHQSHFGAEALVRKIVIRKAYAKEPSDQEAAFMAKLRGHLFYFSSDGRSGSVFANNIAAEQSILSEIASYEDFLQTTLPSLKLKRSGSYVTGILSTNESYLDVLKNFSHAVTSRNLGRGIENLNLIEFTDSGDHIGPTQLELYRSGRGNEKINLRVSIMRPWGYMKNLELYPEFFLDTLNLIFKDGFRKIESRLLESELTPAAIQALIARLTPTVVAKLKALGIEGFTFQSVWRNSPSLIEHKLLILGSKPEEIDEILTFMTGE